MTTSLNPHQMAEEVVQLSTEYQTMSEELSHILQFKASKWAVLRSTEGVTSDKQADRMWERTAEGIREMQLRLIMKASEKKQSALKAMLRILEAESRNTL